MAWLRVLLCAALGEALVLGRGGGIARARAEAMTRLHTATEGSGVPAALKEEIRAYLAVRERARLSNAVPDPAADARDAAMSNPVWRAGNAALSLESFLPASAEEEDFVPDALAYTELEKYGYGRLVEPIMDRGGYATVSRALGIEVSPPPKPKEQSDDFIEYEVRSISLGGSREAKLEEIASSINATELKARRTGNGPKAPSAAAARLDAAAVAKVRASEAAVVAKAARVAKASEVGWPAPLAPFSLGPIQRSYAVAVLALAAAPGAAATGEVLAWLRVDADLAPLSALAAACVAANVAATGVALFRRPERPAYAAFRCLFAGPLALDAASEF